MTDRTVGGLGLKVPLGLGTMYWGDTPLDGVLAGKILSEETLEAIRERSLTAGLTLVDTAEGYGGGTSEARIGRLGFGTDGHFVATKFLPTFWRWTEAAVVRSVRASNRRLGVAACDLLFLHSPVHFRQPDVWIRGAARAYREGRIRALGLSNFNAEQVRRAVAVARAEGIPLVANQIQYSLLVHASPALQETVTVCRELGLTVVGYSVLGQGLLDPRLTPERLEKHPLARRMGLTWDRVLPVRRALAEVAALHNMSVAQVCLQWAIGQGVVPLVGTRSVEQLEDTLGCLDFHLGADETQKLNALALASSTFDRAPWKRLVFLAFLSVLMTAYRLSALARGARRSFPSRADDENQGRA